MNSKYHRITLQRLWRLELDESHFHEMRLIYWNKKVLELDEQCFHGTRLLYWGDIATSPLKLHLIAILLHCYWNHIFDPCLEATHILPLTHAHNEGSSLCDSSVEYSSKLLRPSIHSGPDNRKFDSFVDSANKVINAIRSHYCERYQNMIQVSTQQQSISISVLKLKHYLCL